MILTFKKSIFAPSSQHRSLDEIIDDVKTGANTKDLIGKIRSESNKDRKSEIKKELPAFIPDVVFHDKKHSLDKSRDFSSTGIIQFDIDDYYDEKKSKKIIRYINKEESTIYSFVSPSGGIKFGILTDFRCKDDTIKEKHKIAYQIVKEELDHLFRKLNVDDSTSRVSQQCYLSHDNNAFLNPNAEKLEINSLVNKRYKEKQRQVKRTSRFKKNTDDGEVLHALSYIPGGFRYHERLEINFAIIDHFGKNAKTILMSHWLKRNKKKLEGQIDGQIKTHLSRSGRKYGIGTLFSVAWKNGYRGSPDIEKTEKEPTYYAEKYYSTEESNKRLEKIIHKDFFRDKKDKVVIVECGSGKTRTMFDVVSKFLLNNPTKNVSIFLKTHEMMDQFVEDMNRNISEYNSKNIKDRYPFFHRPNRIQGLKESCKQIGEEGFGITEENIDIIGTSKCKECYWSAVETCPYHEQFEDIESKFNVRIYAHNRLFLKPSLDRDFTPDYLVIDEDIVPLMTDKEETLLVIKESIYSSVEKVLERLRTGKKLISATKSLGKELYSDYETIGDSLDKLKREIKTISENRLGLSGYITKYKKLKNEIDRRDKERSLVEELLEISNGTKLQSKNVWVQEGDDEIPRLIYGRTKKILDEFNDIPILYMDASGEERVIDSMFDRNFEFEYLRVKQQENAKVYQVLNHASFSKRSFTVDTEGKKLDEICNWIDTLETERLGMIRYLHIKGDKTHFKKLDKKVNKVNGGKDYIGWFGNIRGLNRFEDCDTLLVLGQHRLPDYEIFNLSQLIFRQDLTPLDGYGNLTDDYDEYIEKEEKEKVYRMKDGKHESVYQDDYKHPECYFTSNHFDKSETYQSMHRLRLIHGSESKTVYLINDAVIDVSIDQLIDRFKEFGEKNVSVIKYIKKKKYLLDTTDNFAIKFKWDVNTARIFRDARRSGDWMKNHRSLIHWKYETKNKKTGKVISWNKQTQDEVKIWLSKTLSCDIKSLISVKE